GTASDGTVVERPSTVMSTAEAVAVGFSAGLEAHYFGNGSMEGGHIARQLLGTVLKDNPEDAKKLRQYFDVVVKARAKKSRAWQSYWEARKSLDRYSVSSVSSVVTDLDQVLDRLNTSECVYFPIRHHSPACAWHVARVIRESRPSAILVEGPASFTPLISTILDNATKPPIAIYTHFIDTARKIYKPRDGEPDLGPARFA